jgi:predicted DsbA family dithiol-disulfide isomerase
MRALQKEFGADLELEWHSFLLRPHPRRSSGPEALEKFRAYTRSWLRPAAEEDSGSFQVWASDEGPPSHSVPPHRVAKAAERIGPGAFERVHDALLHAYFAENRDISQPETLRDIWLACDLPEVALEVANDPEIEREVLADYQEAIDSGITGVPAFRLAGNEVAITGANPLEMYRRWIQRALDGRIPT